MPTYIIRFGEAGPVKIGRADDVERRIAELQTGNPERLHLLRIIDTYFDTERSFHERFAAHRIRGEWFGFHPDMLAYVPEEPPKDPPLSEIILAARARVIAEAKTLLREMHRRSDRYETRRAFLNRTSKILGLSKSLTKKLYYGERQRIDCAEMEGLRALARKLGVEVSFPPDLPDDAVESGVGQDRQADAAARPAED